MVDYAETLRVTPTTVLPKKTSRNAFVHEFEDGKTKAVNLSGAKYDAEIQWDYISEADRETILDWYHDSAKANGMARTFYWEDPRSGRTYEARFMGPLRTSFVPGDLQSIDKIAVRLGLLVRALGVSSVSFATAEIGAVSIGVAPMAASSVSAPVAKPGSMIRGISAAGGHSVLLVSSTAGVVAAGSPLFGVASVSVVISTAGSVAAGVAVPGVSSVSAVNATAGARTTGLVMSGTSSVSQVSAAIGVVAAGDAVRATGASAVAAVIATAGTFINFATNRRLTETGDDRVTETGDNRVTEEA